MRPDYLHRKAQAERQSMVLYQEVRAFVFFSVLRSHCDEEPCQAYEEAEGKPPTITDSNASPVKLIAQLVGHRLSSPRTPPPTTVRLDFLYKWLAGERGLAYLNG